MAEGLGARGATAKRRARQRAQLGQGDHLAKRSIDDFEPAQASIAMGRADGAASILEDIVAQDPLNGKALLSLGDYYRSKEVDLENAMIQYERASKVKGFESKAYRLARVEVTLKDYANADPAIETANALDLKDYLEDYIRRLEAVLRSS